jgi:hypothetical protein
MSGGEAHFGPAFMIGHCSDQYTRLGTGRGTAHLCRRAKLGDGSVEHVDMVEEVHD